jgi:hypothetical protein
MVKSLEEDVADQAADRRAMSTVLIILSPVVVESSASVPERKRGVKNLITFSVLGNIHPTQNAGLA